VEGPTLIPEINELRARQQRNFLATLIVSQGTPMLCAGDEFARTQHGNNNAYCQDGPLSWLRWDALDGAQLQQFEFVQYLLSLKRDHPLQWHDRYIHEPKDEHAPVILWYSTSGELMQPVHWVQHHCKSVGYLVQQSAADGRRLHYLTLFNAGREPVEFILPELPGVQSWQVLLDTGQASGRPAAETFMHEACALPACSLVMLHASGTVEPDQAKESV
jgi:glycogen operon protein